MEILRFAQNDNFSVILDASHVILNVVKDL